MLYGNCEAVEELYEAWSIEKKFLERNPGE